MAAEFPEALAFLFDRARTKVAYGGRGSGKSWGFARALLIQGAQRPLRVLCAREFQNSIADSVHRLLSDQIAALNLGAFYDIGKQEITGANGTSFAFAGLRHNVTKIKSFEGADIAWVEEGQSVMKSSWDTLTPTIRKPGSEIWVSFNPNLESDETYQRFVVKPPADAIVRKVNWSDNPWFPDVLRAEMLALKERDPDAWLTVWEGHCKQTLDGAVYANEIRRATEAGRFTSVPYDASKPVQTFWDLGFADATAIWFAQPIGFEFRIIDFYSNRGFPVGHYMQEVQRRGYVYDTHWLPHDARAKEFTTGRTVEEQMRAAGMNVRITPNISVEDGINAARTIFDRCFFDAAKCADGIQALRHYRYAVDPETKEWSRKPLHDWASDPADAFRYLAVALDQPPPALAIPAPQFVGGPPGLRWMA